MVHYGVYHGKHVHHGIFNSVPHGVRGIIFHGILPRNPWDLQWDLPSYVPWDIPHGISHETKPSMSRPTADMMGSHWVYPEVPMVYSVSIPWEYHGGYPGMPCGICHGAFQGRPCGPMRPIGYAMGGPWDIPWGISLSYTGHPKGSAVGKHLQGIYYRSDREVNAARRPHCRSCSRPCVRVRRKLYGTKHEISPQSKHPTKDHSSPVTAATSRRCATRQAPLASPSSPASINPGFVCGNRLRTARVVSKFPNVTDQRYLREADRQTEACTRPSMKKFFLSI